MNPEADPAVPPELPPAPAGARAYEPNLVAPVSVTVEPDLLHVPSHGRSVQSAAAQLASGFGQNMRISSDRTLAVFCWNGALDTVR